MDSNHGDPRPQPGGVLTILPPRPPAPPATGEGGDRSGGCWGGIPGWLRRCAHFLTRLWRQFRARLGQRA